MEVFIHLLRHIRGNVGLIWDGLPAHKSRLVRDFIAARGGGLRMEFLPGHALELNPVEYLWGY